MATVVESESLSKDAALVVDVCMSVEADDVVTIICDDDHASQAAAIAEVVVDRGGWPVVMNNEVQVRRGRADVRFPMAPPRNLHQAMVSSDEGSSSRTSMGQPLCHVNAVKRRAPQAARRSSRKAWAWDLTVEDIHPGTARTRSRLWGKKHIRVTTPAGTDHRFHRRTARARGDMKIKRSQMMRCACGRRLPSRPSGLPTAPQSSAESCWIGLPGQVKEPIRWTFEGRRCVRIEGGGEAERLRRDRGVENVEVAGEFAFGTSEKAPFGSPSEAHRHRSSRSETTTTRTRVQNVVAPPRQRLLN
jgi:leucyl aminopeptidase (aminopeptidase T)